MLALSCLVRHHMVHTNFTRHGQTLPGGWLQRRTSLLLLSRRIGPMLIVSTAISEVWMTTPQAEKHWQDLSAFQCGCGAIPMYSISSNGYASITIHCLKTPG